MRSLAFQTIFINLLFANHILFFDFCRQKMTKPTIVERGNIATMENGSGPVFFDLDGRNTYAFCKLNLLIFIF